MSKKVTIDTNEYDVYATVSDADNYFAVTYGNEWSSVASTTKPKLLISATKYIDRQNWQGDKVDKEQSLQFPRIINEEQTDDNLLMEACCEIAMSFYNNNTSLSMDISNLQNVKLGDSSISFNQGANVRSEEDSIIDSFLGNYLISGVQVIL